MHVVVGGTPGRSTTLNMDRCQVKMGWLVNDTTPVRSSLHQRFEAFVDFLQKFKFFHNKLLMNSSNKITKKCSQKDLTLRSLQFKASVLTMLLLS